MGRRCKVCDSIHLAEYNKLFHKGWEIKEIWRKAITENNETFSYESMRRHFRNDVEGVLEAHKKADKLRKQILEEEIKKDIIVAQQIRNDLELLNDMLNKIKDNIDDRGSREEILKIISKIHDTLELLLRFADQIQFKPRISEEAIYEKVVKCMFDFPTDLIIKFMERWKKYESS